MSDQTAEPESTAPRQRVAPLMKRIAEWLRQCGVAVWREVRVVVSYYWTHRAGLAKLFAEYATFFKEHGTRREIWVAPGDDYTSIRWDGDAWQVALPDCCAVCGEPSDQPWQEEQRTVEDLTWPLWLPIAAFVLGSVAAIAFVSRWWILGCVVAGVWGGYRLGRRAQADVRFRRCGQHSDVKRLPLVRLARGSLVVEVGHRAVHRKFREREKGLGPSDVMPEDHDELVHERPGYVSMLPPPFETPPPIPLAGDDEQTDEGDSRQNDREPPSAPPRDETVG